MWDWDDFDLCWLGFVWMEALADACAAGPSQFTQIRPVRNLQVAKGLVTGRVGAAHGGDLVEIACVTPPRGFWEPRLARVRRHLEGLPRDEARASAWGAAAATLEASGLLEIKDLRVSCTCARRRLPCVHVSSLGHAFAQLVEGQPSELLHFLGVDPQDGQFLNGYLGEGFLHGPMRLAPVCAEVTNGTFWAGKPQLAEAGPPVAEAPSTRRDLPLRIQNPPFWPTPDFSGLMTALCQALAAWKLSPAPAPDSFQVGFTEQELAVLRGAVPAPVAAGSAVRRARSAPRGQVIPLHPEMVLQVDHECRQCGAPLREEWRYCSRCGMRSKGG